MHTNEIHDHEPQDWIAASQPGAPAEGLAPLSYPSRASLIPPHLVPTADEGSRAEHRLTLAVADVNARVRMLTDAARSTGQTHNLRLWRDSIQQAVDALARTVLRVPASAICDALAWEVADGEYHVRVRYHQPANVVLH